MIEEIVCYETKLVKLWLQQSELGSARAPVIVLSNIITQLSSVIFQRSILVHSTGERRSLRATVTMIVTSHLCLSRSCAPLRGEL
jgi:hypothetical protein